MVVARHSKKQLRNIRGPLQRVDRDTLHGDTAPCASGEASMIHTAAWLEELRLRQYAEAFAEQAIDFEIVPALNDADLEKLGIPHCIDPTSLEFSQRSSSACHSFAYCCSLLRGPNSRRVVRVTHR
jgi:hypothetical protein